MKRIKLTIAYDGTAYAGWQFQHNARAVQEVIEKALLGLTKTTIRVHGSGRTDSGVHAVGQVAHFDAPDGFEDIPWVKALNPNLPRDVRVLGSEIVPSDFHARYSARSKTYSYAIWIDRNTLLPQRRHYVWTRMNLDVPAMEAAAVHFVGKHDFSAFQNTGTTIKTTVREVTSITLQPGPHPEELVWWFTASGFLKQMVRNIMGCLVYVGRGKIAPQDVKSLLKNRDRTLAPPTAPPQGLTLEHVEYPDFK